MLRVPCCAVPLHLRVERGGGESTRELRIFCVAYRPENTLFSHGAGWSNGDLRRWGLKLAERGGKNAKKRAVVAVARKLAVLLHRLWVSGEVYEPLRNSQKAMQAVA
jgi:transposase